jgi:hypothetical protein
MSTDNPLFWLAILTFLLAVGFAVWSLASTRRQQKYGKPSSGLGGPNDPLA